MTFKQKIYAHCCNLLDEKIRSLKSSLQELEEGSVNDTKSSAGDKHQTARAMMQIEQEKLGKQLNEVFEQKSVLEKIDITINGCTTNFPFYRPILPFSKREGNLEGKFVVHPN